MSELVLVPEQDQAAFNAAAAEGLSPCAWIPEKWDDLRKDITPSGFHRTEADTAPFLSPDSEALRETQRRMGRDKMAVCDPEAPPKDDCRPNPFSDFSHTDPSAEYDQIAEVLGAGPEAIADVLERSDVKDRVLKALAGDEIAYNDAVSVLTGTASCGTSTKSADVATVLQRPEVSDFVLTQLKVNKRALADAISLLQGKPPRLSPDPTRLDALNKLKKIVGPESPGMQRLARVFDWTLCRTTVLMNDLNVALARGSKTDYESARENYLKFLRDLDDHEPEAGTEPIDVTDKKARSGYGRALKWTCLKPSISEETGQILGVRVIVKWNPHSSSNGIPIPHKP